MMPLDSSTPIAWAREGELGKGGTFGAKLRDAWLSGGGGVGKLTSPLDGVGLRLGPWMGFVAPVPRKRAFLVIALVPKFNKEQR